MKNSIPFLITLLSISFLSCNQPQEEKINTSAVKTEVSNLLDNWHKAASDANFENYFGAMDSISVFVGTDASEVWDKKQFENFSKPYFDKGKAWSFKTVDRNIYIHESGALVWFDELLNTWMGVCRGSGVITKKQNEWKIKHYVLSIAVSNEDVNPIVKIKKKRDSLFLSKFK
ncbi:SnoaL-like protein [Tenacibaculum adriaticum]|uniref:SnoaL-like protein n=1 Tax=Tenacibaculum adriaticum TaxID=413713 RepID=A0A5S5DZZ4_9FLAO|nr:nuclear transport factor 2 family protein [Tenacibaculum adriaticum]TYQ00090.1 SnoaL-like protein [Tenacibaculum adriaticum]